LDDFDTIKDDTDNLVKTIMDEVQERQFDGNSKIEGRWIYFYIV
jgi:Holliday junction resolvase RusA-like endonuclease